MLEHTHFKKKKTLKNCNIFNFKRVMSILRLLGFVFVFHWRTDTQNAVVNLNGKQHMGNLMIFAYYIRSTKLFNTNPIMIELL